MRGCSRMDNFSATRNSPVTHCAMFTIAAEIGR